MIKARIKRLVNRLRGKVDIYGSHGRLEIPSIGISVPLYNDGDKQKIVDEPDSAVWFKFGVQDCIADHNYQGFSKINDVVPEETVAVILSPDKRVEYICFRSEVGHIISSGGMNKLRDAHWDYVNLQNPGGLCIYTCLEKSGNGIMDVRLTFWRIKDAS